MLLLIGQTKTKSLARHVLRYVFRYTSIYHHLLDVRTAICLDRDVAVRAVEDAAIIKTPTVACHAFDCRLVFSGEGNARQIFASIKCVKINANHAVRNNHARQISAVVECIHNARHGRTDFYFHRLLDPIWCMFCSASFRH